MVAATAVALLLLFPRAGLGAAPGEETGADAGGTADPDTALHLSLWTTLGGSVAGTAIYLGGWACPVHVTEFENHRSEEVDPGCYLGTRIAGGVLAGAGLVFGPSIGRLYAGDTARGLLLGGLRLLTAGIGGGAMALAIGSALAEGYSGIGAGSGDNEDEEATSSEPDYDTIYGISMTVSVLHLIAFQALVVADIATTRKATRRANERRRQQAVEISLAPAAFPGAGGDVLCGLTIDGSF